VETIGLEPTTPCVQKMDWSVHKRPGAYRRGRFDAHTLPHTPPVATAVATATLGVSAAMIHPIGHSPVQLAAPTVSTTLAGHGPPVGFVHVQLDLEAGGALDADIEIRPTLGLRFFRLLP
jgi:hypothetical protein